MKHFNTKARAATVVLVTGTSLVLAGGVAYAFWTTTGTGTGAASSGTAQALTLAGGSVTGTQLYPGSSGDVVVTITNPNPFPVSVDSLTLPTTAATSFNDAALTSSDSACDAGTGVTWNYTTKTLSGVIVGKKVGSTNGSLTLTLTNGAAMSNASNTNCQGHFFKMPNVTAVAATSSTGTPVAGISQ
jgi:hypothetical protein